MPWDTDLPTRLPSLRELAHPGKEGAPHPDENRSLGGKAARLVWLVRHGFDVPDAYVIPAGVFEAVCREVLPPGHDVRSLIRMAGTREGVERSGRAHARLRQAPFPSWLEAELARIAEQLATRAPSGLAVRSSATCEDVALSSFAGLATSRLGVRGHAALLDAVREVWASLILPRALAYLSEASVTQAAMAVVVQILAEAESSGVATATEGSPHCCELLVNASYGLGAPLVAGQAAPDVLRLLARPGPRVGVEAQVLAYEVARKTESLEVGADGTVARPVPPERQDRRALDDGAISALSSAGLRLCTIERGPWELEFAWQAGRLWMLQARPLVETGYPEGGEADTVWSCTNLAEALPGVATPLTWSVAESFSELGFRRAFAALGCTVPRSTRFVGNVFGRFYLNLTAFMRIAATVPGLDPHTLIDLSGGEGADVLAQQVQDVSHRSFFLRLPWTVARFVREQSNIDEDVRGYERLADRTRRSFVDLDLAILTDDGVATTLRDLQRFLDRTGTLMLTCASNALLGFIGLRLLLGRHTADAKEATQLATILTSGGALRGFGEIESARPTLALSRLAEIAADDPPAMQRLLADPPPRNAEDLPAGPTKEAFERWLAAYGDRGIREAELSTPRWREDPSFPLATLALYVRHGQAGHPSLPPLEEVGTRAHEAMRDLEARLNPLERAALRHMVARCHKFSRLRERMRSWTTWVLGAIRFAALEAGRRLVRRDESLSSGDVFFCTLEEVVSCLRGDDRTMSRVVALRRAEYARDCARPTPPVTFVGRPSLVRHGTMDGTVLQGHAASPGIVVGPVRVLSTPEQAEHLRPGEILVTRTTDVGWTPLFLAAAGVLTELGGPLSHAAIVARELGVPCVVNVAGAMMRLHDGDRIRLDGSLGTVELLGRREGQIVQGQEQPS